jgi:hypothetical protein
MKRRLSRIVMTSLALAMPALLVAGCPLQYSPLYTLDGTYWVDYVKGELVFYELPEERGADAMWYALETEQPQWYDGPGLYETGFAGSWARAGEGTVTLDEIMQVYDPAPRPESPDTRPVGEQLAGLYWVDYADGELRLYRFPKYRDEDGAMRLLETEQPSWYFGPGLYEADEYFRWQRVPLDQDVTLDDIIQLYDFRPRPPGEPAAGAHAGG